MASLFEAVAERVNSNAATGQIFWNNSERNRKKGDRADKPDYAQGYMRIRAGGNKHIYAHRFIWWINNGDIPEGMMIDHINGIKDDNRLENLRLASIHENNRNRRNQTDLRNITKLPSGNYQVHVSINGEMNAFGAYEDLELAKLIESEVRAKYHKEFKYKGD